MFLMEQGLLGRTGALPEPANNLFTLTQPWKTDRQ